jgi:hypothetical protein
MARRQPKNQLPLDFSVSANRVILSLGQTDHQRNSTKLFEGLVNGEWMIEPAGEVADISSTAEVIRQIGLKLPYPSTMKIAQLHQVEDDFTGFSSIFEQNGWIFVNAKTDFNERNYQTYLLTASLGLYGSYPARTTLAARAERLVFDALLPYREVESFFHEGISTIPSSLASEIADFFKVPYPMVLRRALQLMIINDEQYRTYMTIKPTPSKADLYIAREGGLEDLEAHLFGGE